MKSVSIVSHAFSSTATVGNVIVALSLAAAAFGAHGNAQAASLSVVTVAAPAVNCVFSANCTVTVSDTAGHFKDTAYGVNAFLQSRTYAGQPGTPAAGLTAYEYRVALDKQAFSECLVGLTFDFGPVKQLPYPGHPPAHVFVTTQGGIGEVAIKSAEQDGNLITLTFDNYLCPGQSTYFFGLVATGAPEGREAMLFGFGSPPIVQAKVRVPAH